MAKSAAQRCAQTAVVIQFGRLSCKIVYELAEKCKCMISEWTEGHNRCDKMLLCHIFVTVHSGWQWAMAFEQSRDRCNILC